MRKKLNYFGFGFSPEETQHHFLVTMPKGRSRDAEVVISEHFCWHNPKEKKHTFSLVDRENQVKVIIKLNTWKQIFNHVQYEFNHRLKTLHVPIGKWKSSGTIPLSRTFGKELVLLCWALEECSSELSPIALANWLGLAPEERWWLYTMTNAACGDPIQDRNRGWRRAVKYALTDNPISEQVLKSRSLCFPNKPKGACHV